MYFVYLCFKSMGNIYLLVLLVLYYQTHSSDLTQLNQIQFINIYHRHCTEEKRSELEEILNTCMCTTSQTFFYCDLFHSKDKNEKTKKGLKLSGATTQLFHSFFNLKNYSIYIACITYILYR